MKKSAALLFLFVVVFLLQGILAYGQGGLSREVQHEDDSRALVTVTIRDFPTHGFAQLSDTLPEGCSAEPVQRSGGHVKALKNYFKLTWVEMPRTHPLQVQYRMTCSDDRQEGVISGGFQWVSAGKEKRWYREATTFQKPAPKASARPDPKEKYTVQLGAFRQSHSQAFYEEHFQLSGLEVYRSNGMDKVHSGRFATQSAAKAHQRELMGKGVSGFVTKMP